MVAQDAIENLVVYKEEIARTIEDKEADRKGQTNQDQRRPRISVPVYPHQAEGATSTER